MASGKNSAGIRKSKRKIPLPIVETADSTIVPMMGSQSSTVPVMASIFGEQYFGIHKFPSLRVSGVVSPSGR